MIPYTPDRTDGAGSEEFFTHSSRHGVPVLISAIIAIIQNTGASSVSARIIMGPSANCQTAMMGPSADCRRSTYGLEDDDGDGAHADEDVVDASRST